MFGDTRWNVALRLRRMLEGRCGINQILVWNGPLETQRKGFSASVSTLAIYGVALWIRVVSRSSPPIRGTFPGRQVYLITEYLPSRISKAGSVLGF